MNGQRCDVVRIAREWLGTPFIWGGRIKQQCADCTFVAKVYEEAGVLAPVEIPPYGRQAHLNGQSALYDAIVGKVAKREIAQQEADAGDLVLFEMARGRSHGGILLDWPIIIHADMSARAVIYSDIEQVAQHSRKFYTFW